MIVLIKMRVIAGKFKGRTLFYGDKKEHRPTQDRVKESLFNMIQRYCDGAIVLDAFAGTGSLGLEALSRGAERIVFVDKFTQYVEKNTNWLSNNDQILIKKLSIEQFIKSTELKFDLIFLDPPWNRLDLYDITLKLIFDFDILSKEGLIVCEHPKKLTINSMYDKKTKIIGRTSLTLINT